MEPEKPHNPHDINGGGSDSDSDSDSNPHIIHKESK